MKLDFNELPTPCYVLDEGLLKKNLKILKNVIDRTGCKILLAQKGFSMFSAYPIIGKYLSGTTASSLFEAKLGYEEMGKEVHIYSPAYREEEFEEIMQICDHIVFNSFKQWRKFQEFLNNFQKFQENASEKSNKIIENINQKSDKKIEVGIRINPEYAEVETDLYNPCFSRSRLGVTLQSFEEQVLEAQTLDAQALEGIDGLHFHTMCEQNSDVLKRTLQVVDQKFGKYIAQMKWLNFGGGHHITREDYDIETLIECILFIKEKYGIQVYLEPGEAIALNTGFLVAKVLDIMHNDMDIAILDTSAACHMPDVLEMPYRPRIIDAGEPNEYAHTYRLGGPTCLAGDVIGDYSFKQPLKEGDRLVFCDMAHYTMVKNNTFNGINLPTIASFHEKEGIKIIKQFGYKDFKERLS